MMDFYKDEMEWMTDFVLLDSILVISRRREGDNEWPMERVPLTGGLKTGPLDQQISS